MERVLAESKAGQAAQAKLDEQFGQEQQTFQQREQAIREKQAQFERDRPLMSAAQIEKQQQELGAEIRQFEEDFQAVQRQVLEAQQSEGRKVLVPARESLEAIARDMGLMAVFEAGAAGVLFIDAEADITDKVIEAVDSQ